MAEVQYPIYHEAFEGASPELVESIGQFSTALAFQVEVKQESQASRAFHEQAVEAAKQAAKESGELLAAKSDRATSKTKDTVRALRKKTMREFKNGKVGPEALIYVNKISDIGPAEWQVREAEEDVELYRKLVPGQQVIEGSIGHNMPGIYGGGGIIADKPIESWFGRNSSWDNFSLVLGIPLEDGRTLAHPWGTSLTVGREQINALANTWANHTLTSKVDGLMPRYIFANRYVGQSSYTLSSIASALITLDRMSIKLPQVTELSDQFAREVDCMIAKTSVYTKERDGDPFGESIFFEYKELIPKVKQLFPDKYDQFVAAFTDTKLFSRFDTIANQEKWSSLIAHVAYADNLADWATMTEDEKTETKAAAQMKLEAIKEQVA